MEVRRYVWRFVGLYPIQASSHFQVSALLRIAGGARSAPVGSFTGVLRYALAKSRKSLPCGFMRLSWVRRPKLYSNG